MGSNQNGLDSEDATGTDDAGKKSFVLSIPTMDVLTRVAKRVSHVFAGASAFGTPMVPKADTPCAAEG